MPNLDLLLTGGGYRSFWKFPNWSNLHGYAWLYIIYIDYGKIWHGRGHCGSLLACQIWPSSANGVGPWGSWNITNFVKISVFWQVFAPLRRQNKPIRSKFGVEAYTEGLLLCRIWSWSVGGRWVQKTPNFNMWSKLQYFGGIIVCQGRENKLFQMKFGM